MRRFGLGGLIASVIITAGVPWSVAFAQGAPAASLEQSLAAQYQPGTVLVIQGKGIIGVNPGCATSLVTTYKDGQLHAPGFLQQLAAAGIQCITRGFPVGWKVNLLSLAVVPKNSKVNLVVQECDACNGSEDASYKAVVGFEFPKGFLATAELGPVQDAINQVFSIDASASAASDAPAPQAANQPAVPGPEPSVQVGGVYVNPQNADERVQLNPDGSFLLFAYGQPHDGTFSAAGNQLTLTISQTGRTTTVTLDGDKLHQADGTIWVLQAPQSEPAQPAPAQPAPTTIELGQTTDQVVAALGPPSKIVKLGSKEIYVYKDLKVTFVDGKVSDVQ